MPNIFSVIHKNTELIESKGAALKLEAAADGASTKDGQQALVQTLVWTYTTIVLTGLEFLILLPITVWFLKKTKGVVKKVPRGIVILNLVTSGLIFTSWTCQLLIHPISDPKIQTKYSKLLFVVPSLPQYVTQYYILRFKRVQVQLRTEKEETNAIIEQIVQSEKA